MCRSATQATSGLGKELKRSDTIKQLDRSSVPPAHPSGESEGRIDLADLSANFRAFLSHLVSKHPWIY